MMKTQIRLNKLSDLRLVAEDVGAKAGLTRSWILLIQAMLKQCFLSQTPTKQRFLEVKDFPLFKPPWEKLTVMESCTSKIRQDPPPSTNPLNSFSAKK